MFGRDRCVAALTPRAVGGSSPRDSESAAQLRPQMVQRLGPLESAHDLFVLEVAVLHEQALEEQSL